MSSTDISAIEPLHYKRLDIEPIKYMESTLSSEAYMGFCIGNIIKYASRLGHKDLPLNEAKKIQAYANYLVEHLEENRAVDPYS